MTLTLLDKPVAQTGVLQNRRFVFFLIGQGVSNFGDRLSEAALAVLLVKQFGEGALFQFQTIPLLFTIFSGLPLFVGAVMERQPAKRSMILSNVGLLAVTLAFLLDTQLWWFVLLQVIRQFLDHAFGAAYSRFFPHLLPASQLTRGQGLQSIVGRITTIAGQLLGVSGALWLGYQVLWVDGLTFLVAIAAFGAIHFEVKGERAAAISREPDTAGPLLPRMREAVASHLGTIARDASTGVKFAFGNRAFLAVILLYAAAHVCWGAGSMAMYSLVAGLGEGLEGIGRYQAVQTVAELVAGLGIYLGKVTERAIPLSLALLAVSFIGAGAVTHLPVSQSLQVLIGARGLKATEGVASNFVGNLLEIKALKLSPEALRARLRGFIGLSTLVFNLLGKTFALVLLQLKLGAPAVYIATGILALGIMFVAQWVGRGQARAPFAPSAGSARG